MSQHIAPELPRRGSLRLLYCPGCGYALDGLPLVHMCPECGFAYDQDMFAVYGRLVDDKCYHPAFVLLPVGLIGFALYHMVINATISMFASILILVGVGTIAEWGRKRTRSYGMAGTEQFLFTGAGLGQRTGWGPVRVLPWSMFTKLRVLKVFGGKWRFDIHKPLFGVISLGPHVGGVIELAPEDVEVFKAEITRRLRTAHKACS